MSIQITPLSCAIGAEVKGIDPAQPMGGNDFEVVRDAWLEYKIILFRGASLSPDEQTRFARQFGDIQQIRSATHLLGEDQEFMHVSNREVEGKPGILPEGEMQFHNDQSYYERPAKATILNAIEVPKTGGHTLFLNAVMAYTALPAVMKERIEGLSVHNIYDYDTNPTIKGDGIRAGAPQFTHPMVIRHPDTSEKALFVSRLMSDHIPGMERGESDTLLAELFHHMEHPEFIHEHAWMPGDLLMWDNFASQHARTNFDPIEARILRRVAVAGPRPAAV